MVLQEEFHIGMDDPAIIAVDGDIDSAATQSAIAELIAKIDANSTFSSTFGRIPCRTRISAILDPLRHDPLR